MEVNEAQSVIRNVAKIFRACERLDEALDVVHQVQSLEATRKQAEKDAGEALVALKREKDALTEAKALNKRLVEAADAEAKKVVAEARVEAKRLTDEAKDANEEAKAAARRARAALSEAEDARAVAQTDAAAAVATNAVAEALKADLESRLTKIRAIAG